MGVTRIIAPFPIDNLVRARNLLILKPVFFVDPCWNLEEVPFPEKLLFALLDLDNELPHGVDWVDDLVNLPEAALVKLIQHCVPVLERDAIEVLRIDNHQVLFIYRPMMVHGRNLLQGALRQWIALDLNLRLHLVADDLLGRVRLLVAVAVLEVWVVLATRVLVVDQWRRWHPPFGDITLRARFLVSITLHYYITIRFGFIV